MDAIGDAGLGAGSGPVVPEVAPPQETSPRAPEHVAVLPGTREVLQVVNKVRDRLGDMQAIADALTTA